MAYRSRSRQLLLILIAIVLPAVVLVALAIRLVRQESELAKTQAATKRREAVEVVRRELAARLEAVKLQEVNRWIRVPNVPNVEQAPDPSLVFVAALDGERMILPWDTQRKETAPPPLFRIHRQLGESLEFIAKNIEGAAAEYHQARLTAQETTETCEATLLEARVLVKAGRAKDAARLYRDMLKSCDAISDQDGVTYALYAAERLLNAVKDAETAYRYVVDRTDHARWMSPYDAHLIRSLLKEAPGQPGESARSTIDGRLAELERITAFAKEFHRVRPLAEMEWVAYGPEPWLVTVTAAEAPLPSLVFVVSSAVGSERFVPPAATLVTKDTPGSEPLGQGFSGINVRWKTENFETQANRGSPLLYGIAFILGVTILAGYLLFRDVTRDVRMAEMRSQFVASVSHELKTPLTAIRMFAETLALGRARDERTRSEYLETIVNESERLARLVDNVLDFSKIEQGKKIYRMQPAHLRDIVQSAARAMHYPLAQQGFTLNVSIDETLSPASADADAMEQAVLNLLSNAMKYSGDAREIDLSLKHDGEEAVIEVRDRGVGIDASEQTRIFDRFYRSKEASASMVAGTGLGLTVVQHIAKAHGGRVEVQSAAGVGSTFSIRIPVPESGARI